MPHRFGNEAAQRSNRFFDRWSSDDLGRERGRKSRFQLTPEPIVRPLVNVRAHRTLNVIAAQHWRTLGSQRKAPRVLGVNDVFERRRFRHDRQPTERIYALEGRENRARDALARYAMKTITAGDEIASDLVGRAVPL